MTTAATRCAQVPGSRRAATGTRSWSTASGAACIETWNTRRTASGWRAGSGAVWNLRSNALRPAGWTSADAAGLPILPGLLRWSEVRSGRVDHAIRFTAPTTAPRYVWPARHQAGDDPGAPPMGARFRLRADFDVSGFSPHARTVLTAMRDYGLVLADNGSAWYFQGATNAAWPEGLLDEFKTVPAGAFEAVDTVGDDGVAGLRPGAAVRNSPTGWRRSLSGPVSQGAGTLQVQLNRG